MCEAINTAMKSITREQEEFPTKMRQEEEKERLCIVGKEEWRKLTQGASGKCLALAVG